MSNLDKYCPDIFHYQKRKTREVMVGKIGVGGDNPIRVQSMTIADTMDTKATVNEAIQLADAGCEIVRITAPSINEAENLRNIKAELLARGYDVPLVADIHFTPNAAMIAADHVEKVRINPGNYADKKKFEQYEYSDDEYEKELLRIEDKFTPLVLKCKKLGRSIRIGTNHGSLSDRIMNRYGDTAKGMVESALEFVQICENNEYYDVILSMKSSNPLVAIQAYRLLAARMDELSMDYPFHLGVTEAGDGGEGRIKSAVGIGGLLEDGIGDTIRVSLTEDAIKEIPVAQMLAKKYNAFSQNGYLNGKSTLTSQVKMPPAFDYLRRDTLVSNQLYYKIGGGNEPRVELPLNSPLENTEAAVTEITGILGQSVANSLNVLNGNGKSKHINIGEIVHFKLESQNDIVHLKTLRNETHKKHLYISFAVDVSLVLPHLEAVLPLAEKLVFTIDENISTDVLTGILTAARMFNKPVEWKVVTNGKKVFSTIDNILTSVFKASLKSKHWNFVFSLESSNGNADLVRNYRYLAGRLDAKQGNFPIVLRYKSAEDYEQVILSASSQLGALFCDGIGDSICIDSSLSYNKLLDLSFNLLQATRLRISKTDYISCPSCGRTLFDLQTTTERIKSQTEHLKGVKIAIMGCIVNGPGEMADADFGYVGSGPNKINLYVGKECVERNIPEDEADQRLIDLIKKYGKWMDN